MKMNKPHKLISRLMILPAVLALSIALAACGGSPIAKTDSTFYFTDDYGNAVEVPVHPKRVVSLSPAVTEIMFAIHADSLLVGRTEFCVYPTEADQIENIGGISNLNIEKVLSCQPDLIISGSMIPRKVVEQFAKMGVPMVCVIEKPHFSDLFGNIKTIGSLVGHNEEANNLVGELQKELDGMRLSLDSNRGSKPTCYYVVGFGSGGNFTAGGNTFINEIIDMAGGVNIAQDSEGWSFSLEALMDADPDYILIRAEDSANFCKTAPYNRLSAVKKGHLIALEDGILDLQVPRNIEVLRRLHEIFAYFPSLMN